MPRRGERKIDAFKVEVEGETIEVPVWLIHVEAAPYVEKGTKFRAIHEDSSLHLENTDINELRKEVEKEIDAWYNIDWELWILVEACRGRSFQKNYSVEFSYEFYGIGNRPDGKRVYVRVPEPDSFRRGDRPWDGEWNSDHRFGGESVIPGLPRTGTTEAVNYGERKTCTLIPATVENAEAVRHFDEMLHKLADEIIDRFEEKSIEDTIMRISKVPAIHMLQEATKTEEEQ